MAAGLGILRLTPCDFWAMTPREFDAALRGHFGIPATATAFSRHILDALMQRFPDRPEFPCP